MLWSPPNVSNLDFGLLECDKAGEWEPSSRKASLICPRARALSKGVIGMSPQSRMVKGEE